MNEEKEKPERKESFKLEKTKIDFRNGVSVYEGKMAVLIFGAVLTLVFSLSMYYLRADISSNLTSLMETFILCLAGVTTAEAAFSVAKEKDIFTGKRGEK